MTHSDFRELFVQAHERTIIGLVVDHSQSIKELFEFVEYDRKVVQSMELILLRLSDRNFTNEVRSTEEVQSLITHLSFFFKKSNKFHYVQTCYNFLKDSVFKRRIDAWLHYQRYQKPQEHITQFERFIEKLSDARFEDGGDSTYDLLQDLKEYRDHALIVLAEPHRTNLETLFADSQLIRKYSLLEEYLNQHNHRIPRLVVKEYTSKEYEPSIFSEEVFEKNFLTYIRKNSPDYPRLILGHDGVTITQKIINQGQADFDSPNQACNISASDVVKLYCFYNMRMHYFTSLSIFERSRIVEKYYNANGRIKFIDIGCGPGTSGLALTEHIYNVTGGKASFDYFGVDCSSLMMEMARSMLLNNTFQEGNILEFHRNVSEIDLGALKNYSCIIVNACYLFASSTLDVTALAAFIHCLKLTYPGRPKYFFFQNPEYDLLNVKYEQFKNQIDGYSTLFSEVEVIRYHTKRNAFTEAKKRSVYFEVLEIL
jgi:hypothetical protein